MEDLTCVCARVPLQVEGVVEALAAEGAEVALDVRMTLPCAGSAVAAG